MSRTSSSTSVACVLRPTCPTRRPSFQSLRTLSRPQLFPAFGYQTRPTTYSSMNPPGTKISAITAHMHCRRGWGCSPSALAPLSSSDRTSSTSPLRSLLAHMPLPAVSLPTRTLKHASPSPSTPPVNLPSSPSLQTSPSAMAHGDSLGFPASNHFRKRSCCRIMHHATCPFSIQSTCLPRSVLRGTFRFSWQQAGRV